MNGKSPRSTLTRAVDALARRDHSRRELARKLARGGADETEVAATLDDLATRGLQSDERYAEGYVRQRAASGHGPRRLLGELAQRGIDAAAAAQALATAECDWKALARATRVKKFGAATVGGAAERARQARFLEYRGFEPEHIRYALGPAADDEDL